MKTHKNAEEFFWRFHSRKPSVAAGFAFFKGKSIPIPDLILSGCFFADCSMVRETLTAEFRFSHQALKPL